jgi:hypothetical protein
MGFPFLTKNSSHPYRCTTCLVTDNDASLPPDELILLYLGAAAMLCWTKLPLSARETILNQADDIIGITPAPGIRNEIEKLLLRRSKAA